MRRIVVPTLAALWLAWLPSPALTEPCDVCSEVSFSGTSAFVVASDPTGAAAADLDGDGWVDLAVAEEAAGRIVLFRGNGAVFRLWQTLSVGAATGAIVAADFDGDGRADLAVAQPGGSSVSVFLNQPAGFARTDWSFAASPASLLALDLDGDSRIDLAAACQGAGGVAVRRGTAGGFGAVELLPTGDGPRSLAAGDLNGDGRPDLVTANGVAGTVSVLLNAQTGYLPAVSYPAPPSAVAVVVAQLAGDGSPDVAVLGKDWLNSLLDVRPGTGDGGLGAASRSSTSGNDPRSLLAHDLDRDGDVDLLLGGAWGSTILRWQGETWTTAQGLGAAASASFLADVRGDGIEQVIAVDYIGDAVAAFETLRWGAADSLSPWLVTSGDFDGDQRIDVAYASRVAGKVYLQRGDGTGGLGAPTAVATINDPHHIISGDVNGDGQADLVVSAHAYGPGPGLLVVLYGTGAGTFTAVPVDEFGRPIFAALGDLNGDGRVDIVTANARWPWLSVFLASPTGGFLYEREVRQVDHHPLAVILADFNGDTRLDAAVGFSYLGVHVLLGDGTGSFGEPLELDTGDSPAPSLAAGDLDGDGDVDLAAGDDASHRVNVFLGDGQGNFGGVAQFAGGGDVSLTIVDVSGDGRPDLVSAGSEQSTLSILVGTGAGMFESRSVSVSDNWMSSLTVADLNADGRPDVIGAGPRTTVMLNTRCEARRLGLRATFPTCAAVGAARGAEILVRDDGGNLVCSSSSVNARLVQAGTAVPGGLGGEPSVSAVGGIAAFDTLTIVSPGFDQRVVFESAAIAPAQTASLASLSPTGLIEGPTRVMEGDVATFRMPPGASGYLWWLDGVDAAISGPEASLANLSVGTHVVEAQAHAVCGNRSSHTFEVVNGGFTPSLMVDDVTVAEGDAGTTNLVFTVTLSSSPGVDVTVNFATSDGTALSASDYQAQAGTLTFTGSELMKTVTVAVNGDTLFESDEKFTLQLGASTNATILDGVGVGTLSNDDPVTYSIDDVTVVEGDTGTTDAVFTVTLSGPSAQTVTVGYETLDGTATAGVDYEAAIGSVIFTPGSTKGTITVQVNGDTGTEPEEYFRISLTPSGGGVGRISDDDPAAPGDVDRNGIGDVLLRQGTTGDVRVLTSNGTVFANVPFAAGINSVRDVYYADVTGDGQSDLVTRRWDTGVVEVYASNGTAFNLLPGTAPGGAWAVGWNTTFDLYFGDVTGDGKADLVGRSENGDVSVFPTVGNEFSAAQGGLWTYGWNTGYRLYLADVTGDGRADLIGQYLGPAAGLTGDVYVGISSGTRFESVRRWSYGFSGGYELYFGDVDGDKDADLVARYDGPSSSIATGDVLVMRSDGTTFGWDGQFDPWTYGWGATYDLVLRDATGDGRVDLIGRHSGDGTVYVAPASGTAFVFDGSWATGIDSSFVLR
jgi:hypothetical protein